MARSLTQMIDALRAAAEPTRLRLLAICSEGELTVSEITDIVGQSQPRVSRHLKLLCNARLLIRFREGHFVLYRVPANGEDADIVQNLLSLLPEGDDQLLLDRERMEEVKTERARRAAKQVGQGAGQWEQLRSADISDAKVNRAINQILEEQQIGDLLEIGAGSGRMLKLLGKHASSAVGVDTSSQMLAIARSNLHAAGLGRVMVRRADIYGLPYPDASFSTVTLDHVLYPADDPLRAVREAARVLRPDGKLLVIDFRVEADCESGRPGITDRSLVNWLEESGLRCSQLKCIPGKSLQLLLSVAEPVGSSKTAVA